MEEEIHPPGRSKIDLVLFQTGVGSFAAAGALYYARRYGDKRPTLICVEPLEAAGFLDSIVSGHGRPITAKGEARTIMAGLNCGTPSLNAWPVLKTYMDLFMAVPDDYAVEAVRECARAGIVSGETGAAGLAGLLALIVDPTLREAREAVGISRASRVLLINTEGDTDPDNYQRILKGERNDTHRLGAFPGLRRSNERTEPANTTIRKT
jgi:diaminopropionate ammonia-lyase